MRPRVALQQAAARELARGPSCRAPLPSASQRRVDPLRAPTSTALSPSPWRPLASQRCLSARSSALARGLRVRLLVSFLRGRNRWYLPLFQRSRRRLRRRRCWNRHRGHGRLPVGDRNPHSDREPCRQGRRQPPQGWHLPPGTTHRRLRGRSYDGGNELPAARTGQRVLSDCGLLARRKSSVSHGRCRLRVEAVLGHGRVVHRRLCRQGIAVEDTVERGIAIWNRRQPEISGSHSE